MATETTKTEVGSYFIANYPPFSQWSAEALSEVRAALDAPPLAPGGQSRPAPLGLYLHIPFCRKRCKFCYFRVYTDKNAGDVETYVAALSREIELVSRLAVMGGRPFRFVYFGGGTPSFLSAKQLTSLVDRLRANINWDQAEEVTFECEPGTLSEPKVATLRQLGVTRLSLGIENFSEAILEENGRAHLSAEVYKSWEWIRRAGFPNVNVDLIAGMVGETWDNWKDSVARTVDLGPESVTIYQMELPFNTVYSSDILGHRIETPVADWPTKRAWVDYAFDALAAAGFSVSSAYTMVKDKSKVNFSYRDNLWHGSDMLATGVASFVASTWWYGPAGLSVGSSGAVLGLMGILISYISQRPGFAGEYRASLIRWAIFILVIGIFFGSDNAAHLGGLLAGMALGRLVSDRRPTTPPARLRLALMSWGSVLVIAWSLAMVLLHLPSGS